MMQNTKQLYILFYYIEFLNCFELALSFDQIVGNIVLKALNAYVPGTVKKTDLTGIL